MGRRERQRGDGGKIYMKKCKSKMYLLSLSLSLSLTHFVHKFIAAASERVSQREELKEKLAENNKRGIM
jgi:hypothetical protein